MSTHTIIEGIVAVLLIGRGVMSHLEHKKTGRQITEIKISINGELEKRLVQAREDGVKEGIESTKRKK